jgi:hypothetical protein
MEFTRTDPDFAHELDAGDELALFRTEFVIE